MKVMVLPDDKGPVNARMVDIVADLKKGRTLDQVNKALRLLKRPAVAVKLPEKRR